MLRVGGGERIGLPQLVLVLVRRTRAEHADDRVRLPIDPEVPAFFDACGLPVMAYSPTGLSGS